MQGDRDVGTQVSRSDCHNAGCEHSRQYQDRLPQLQHHPPPVDTSEVGFEAGPDEAGLDSSALDQLMEEPTQGQAAKWKPTEEIAVEGGLLPADVEVVTMLRRERL